MPFVMITAEAARGKVRAAIYAGMNDSILQPFTHQILEAKGTAMRAYLPDPSGCSRAQWPLRHKR